MTEAEWLAATDPIPMLGFLRADGWRAAPSDGRKLRLFACVCVRQLWSISDPLHRRAVEVAEQYADGERGWEELQAAEAARASAKRVDPFGCLRTPAEAAREALESDLAYFTFPARDRKRKAREERRRREQCALLHDVFGNPFRPAPALDPAWLAWNGGTAGRVAEAAYTERQLPSGHLAPARLKVLADSLEDAGCANAELFGHLRSPGPHIRGCWAVDLLTARN